MVEVETDEGITGLGEMGGGGESAALAFAGLKTYLVGNDPFDLNRMRYDAEPLSGAPRAKVIQAMGAEGIPVTAIYPPLNKEPFIEQNLRSRGFQAAFSKERLEKYRRENHLPQNDRLCATSLYLPQEILIGEKNDVDDVLEAFSKVQKNASMLV